MIRNFLLLAVFMVLAWPAGAQGVSVVGSVRDEAGRPVREALVVIDPDSLSLRGRADAEGRYRIANVPAGSFEIRVVRIGFRPQSRTIEVGNSNVTLDFVMQGVPLPLDTVAVRVARSGLYGTVATRGIALLPHAPRPLSGASIEIINGPHRTRSARDGTFSMPELAEGSHMVMVTLERYASRMVPVTIGPEGGVSVDIVLDSSYADYQQWDEAQNQGIGFRMRRAVSPATLVTPHELDLGAKELREAMRFAPSLLGRGVRLWQACVFVNGKYHPSIEMTDIDPRLVEAVEVYPKGTVPESLDGLEPPQIGTPCDYLRSRFAVAPTPGSPGEPRRPVSERLSEANVVLVWTRGRR